MVADARGELNASYCEISGADGGTVARARDRVLGVHVLAGGCLGAWRQDDGGVLEEITAMVVEIESLSGLNLTVSPALAVKFSCVYPSSCLRGLLLHLTPVNL